MYYCYVCTVLRKRVYCHSSPYDTNMVDRIPGGREMFLCQSFNNWAS